MTEFGFASAWSSGLRIFAGTGLAHAVFLIGIGAGVPLALQYLLLGEAVAIWNPVTGTGGAEPGGGNDALTLAVLGVGFALQLGSFFASWRFGLGPPVAMGRAAAFGLLAGLISTGGGALLIAVGAALAQISPVLSALVVTIAFVMMFVLFQGMIAAVIAVGWASMLVVGMVFGAATGQPGFAATLVGGSGFVVVLLLMLAALFLWLIARSSCAGAVMAARPTLNPFAAIAESWRLTGEEQWRIMGYLAVIGLVLALLAFAAAIATGAAVAAALSGGDTPDLPFDPALFSALIGIPIAYLSVLVPAGIYRELIGTGAPVDVFA